MPSLKGKVILITGASSGIGQATSVYLSKFEPKLVLSGRNLDNLKQVAQECGQNGLSEEEILISPGDLTVEADIQKIVADIEAKFGRLDVLINNAGQGMYKSLMDTKPEDFDLVMNINLKAPLRLCQLCIPLLEKSKGNIVNISSISSSFPFIAGPSYCMAKAGLDMLTKLLAVELGPKGIRVNSVNPGVVVTNFQRTGGMAEENYQKYLDRQNVLQPISGPIDPIDVAKAIKYFASDDAAVVSGQILFVDGGRTVRVPT